MQIQEPDGGWLHGSTNPQPKSAGPRSRLGLDVIYVLNDADARLIIQRRIAAGTAHLSGNDPRAGDQLSARIVKDFGVYGPALERAVDQAMNHWDLRKHIGTPTHEELAEREHFEAELRRTWTDNSQLASTNLQVFLDGTDTYWATSRSEFEPTKHGRYQQLENASGSATVNGDWIPDPEGHWIAMSDMVG